MGQPSKIELTGAVLYRCLTKVADIEGNIVQDIVSLSWTFQLLDKNKHGISELIGHH